MLLAMLGQTFESHDLAIVALLVLLEGTLSIDNALVLGLLAKRLPKHQQKRALTYGLVGAFVFRFVAIAVATVLLKYTIFKLLGGAYLLYVALKHFVFESGNDEKQHVRIGPDGQPILEDEPNAELSAKRREEEIGERSPLVLGNEKHATKKFAKFWPTVLVIELTDIAFAVDSIVAAIGVVGPKPDNLAADATHPKLWIVILGGFIGVILMRFAAVLFIRLLEKFPRFELAAYLLVTLIGSKLVLDWAAHKFDWTSINFHSTSSPAFWIFWVGMAACFSVGFIKKNRTNEKPMTNDQ